MTKSEILPECKIKFNEQEKDMVSFKKTLFGDDGLGGVCGCLKDKISKKNMPRFVLAAISILLTLAIVGFTAWGGVKDSVSDNAETISVIQSELTHIKKTTEIIEKNQMKPADLLNAIRRIINDEE